eukprot:symbB.v1.2.015680.t1/scaffold1179.1/size133475/3
MAPLRGNSTCDVKELFSPQRHRLLRGEPEPPGPVADGLSLGNVPRSGTWRAFPDPAVKALLQEKTQQTLEVLERCGSSLQLCHRDMAGSRHSLRHCRTLLEAHQASSLAVCELLTGWTTLTPPVDTRWSSSRRRGMLRCPVTKRACFFCRERQALEDTDRLCDTNDGLVVDSAALADVSGCSSSSSSGILEVPWPNDDSDLQSAGKPAGGRQFIQKRKTSRERGQKLYKRRSKVSATWYATHTVDTVDPPRSVDLPAEVPKDSLEPPQPVLDTDVVSETLQKPPELDDAAELEPYTSAAARFRAAMEFLDMSALSSVPASPEANFLRRTSESRLPVDKTRAMGLVIDVEAEVVGPPAPPPSTSHSMVLGAHLKADWHLEVKDPLKGWRQLLVKTGLIARRRRSSFTVKMMALRGWQSYLKSKRSSTAGPSSMTGLAVHQPMPVPQAASKLAPKKSRH